MVMAFVFIGDVLCFSVQSLPAPFLPQEVSKRLLIPSTACIVLDHHLASHLDKPSSYTRILFLDFTSAFNTIVPNILLDRLKALVVAFYLRSVVK